MPTPIPSSEQILTAVTKTVDNALQLQALGALVIVAIAFMIVAAAILVYVIRRPTKTAGEHDVSIAISSLADKAEERAKKAEERAQKKEDQLQKQNEKHSDEMKVMGEQFLEAMRQMAIANTLLGGNQTIQITGIEKITTVVEKIDKEGSTPVQGIVIKVNEVFTMVQELKDKIVTSEEIKTLIETELKKYEDGLGAVKTDISLIKRSIELCIERKRKEDSQEMNTVIVPQQTMKVDTSNLIAGDEAATKPEAA